MTDPERRQDGRCAREGCPNPLIKTPPKTMSRAFRAWFLPMLADDPWCSATCCRLAYQATEHSSPYLVNHGVPNVAVTKSDTASRAEYRQKNRVECEGGCGKLVEGKGRSNRNGSDPNRPHMCPSCSRQWRAHQSRKAKEMAT